MLHIGNTFKGIFKSNIGKCVDNIVNKLKLGITQNIYILIRLLPTT